MTPIEALDTLLTTDDAEERARAYNIVRRYLGEERYSADNVTTVMSLWQALSRLTRNRRNPNHDNALNLLRRHGAGHAYDQLVALAVHADAAYDRLYDRGFRNGDPWDWGVLPQLLAQMLTHHPDDWTPDVVEERLQAILTPPENT